MNYAELREINVNEYVEKKGDLSYMSWSSAVDQLLLRDPTATWEYRYNADGAPYIVIGDTAMVFCTVNAFGVSRQAQLPVMNARNEPISFSGKVKKNAKGAEWVEQIDSFNVNTAMQRCLAKAIALHGIGLYIYEGEDLPPGDGESRAKRLRSIADQCIALHAKAELMVELNSDTSGFWALYECAAEVTDQEERLQLWGMLKEHSKIRSALKEYASLDAKQKAKQAIAEAA